MYKQQFILYNKYTVCCLTRIDTFVIWYSSYGINKLLQNAIPVMTNINKDYVPIFISMVPILPIAA